MNKEYIILYNNKVWSDRLNSKEDCIDHINENVEKNNMNIGLFDYREMSKDEIKKYTLKVL